MAKVHHGNQGPATRQMNSVLHECTQCGEMLTEHIQGVECGNSCHECGRYSYRADQPSYLYLLTHPQLQLHKIGIGTAGKDKGQLELLVAQGWTVYGMWHDGDARRTFQWETAIFKKLEVAFATGETDSPGLIGRRDRSWVESISATAISVVALAELMSTVVSGKEK